MINIYGKHFGSLYEGSMVGAGAVPFAVWGYVIAKKQPDHEHGSVVRINPTLLSVIIGESVDKIDAAVAFLCAPDARSASKECSGRRLIKIGEYDYQVVNGAKYDAIRSEEDRREQNRVAQQRFRDKSKAAKEIESGNSKLAKAIEKRGMAEANARDVAELNSKSATRL